jgi:hypothetical protein
MRLHTAGWLAALGALGCAMTVPASPAHGYVPNSYLVCFNSSEADLLSLERSLSPAINAFVQAGTPVMFSGNSGAPVTFAVASSAALLSSPDLGSGPGTLEPGTSSYTFTSTTATATPGVLVYWDVSFSNATITGCEGMTPKTYTTAVRTFTVVSPSPSPTEAEAAAKKKQEEEAAAVNKKKEEEKPPATGGVSLEGSTITVQSGGEALIKLACTGTGTCSGKLTLTANSSVNARGAKGEKARSVMVETVGFSIAGDETRTVRIKLDAAGRMLLKADHGRVSASLAILELAPGAANTQVKAVRLVGEKGAKGRRP